MVCDLTVLVSVVGGLLAVGGASVPKRAEGRRRNNRCRCGRELLLLVLNTMGKGVWKGVMQDATHMILDIRERKRLNI